MDNPNDCWYDNVASDISPDELLQQGDLVMQCPIVNLEEDPVENEEYVYDINDYDIIVMSQSCDLVSGKTNLVLVCPFAKLESLPEYDTDNKKESLRKGRNLGTHLLNRCDLEGESDFLVVDFRSTHSVPLHFIQKFVAKQKNRKRLLTPYREHLSQAFAMFFMRVGLPSGIPSFKEKAPQTTNR